jgi:hypothetical protein
MGKRCQAAAAARRGAFQAGCTGTGRGLLGGYPARSTSQKQKAAPDHGGPLTRRASGGPLPGKDTDSRDSFRRYPCKAHVLPVSESKIGVLGAQPTGLGHAGATGLGRKARPRLPRHDLLQTNDLAMGLQVTCDYRTVDWQVSRCKHST